MSGLYVLLSSFLDARWERRTGIARVEYEIARTFVARGAHLIRFEPRRRAFVLVDFETVSRIVRAQDADLDATLDAPFADGCSSMRRAVAMAARGLISCGLRGKAGTALFAATSDGLGPVERRQTATRLRLSADINLATRYLDALHQGCVPQFAEIAANSPAFGPGDVVFIPGIIWQAQPIELLERLRLKQGVRMLSFVHDLIPVRHPEYHTDSQGVSRFRRYLDWIVCASDCCCVASEFVARDLSAFAEETASKVLRVARVGLCANVTPETVPTETGRLTALKLSNEGFALFVATFNPRKNHYGAYQLWLRLRTALGDKLPPLVLAGQRGWNSSDLINQMSRDADMWGNKIHFVESPTDGELAYLYRNCAFTVFPSHYEGWGLPVTESLSFGKPCLAADNSSLREAGQGLAEHIDNLDGLAWIETLTRYIRSKSERDAASERIQLQFLHRTWDDVGREIFDVATDVATRASTGINTTEAHIPQLSAGRALADAR